MSTTFPCHPERAVPAGAGWLSCPICATAVRAGAAPADLYDDSYPDARGHHDPAVGRCKVRTLDRWLAAAGLTAAGRTICEVGFGGGAGLAALQAQGATVLGTEPVDANRAHAESLGIPSRNIFPVDPLPALPSRPDLWLFQDSFEHVPDPNALVRWIARESAPGRTHVLLVAPDGASPSRRLMGRFWLHEVPDHLVHYSPAGVAAIFGRAGFRVTRRFRPLKYVSLSIVRSHLRVLTGRPAQARAGLGDRLAIWFNFGEMGLLLERDEHSR